MGIYIHLEDWSTVLFLLLLYPCLVWGSRNAGLTNEIWRVPSISLFCNNLKRTGITSSIKVWWTKQWNYLAVGIALLGDFWLPIQSQHLLLSFLVFLCLYSSTSVFYLYPEIYSFIPGISLLIIVLNDPLYFISCNVSVFISSFIYWSPLS